MKKKYKSKSVKQLRKMFGIDKEESKPTVCPECGKELLGTSIACGFECCFEYLCLKCPREVVIGTKSGMKCNKKLSRNELIKRMMKYTKLNREITKELIKKWEEHHRVSR